MPANRVTTNTTYTDRLRTLEYKKWKSLLDVQRPYRWNITRLNPGKTLDIGCGIGRYLKCLPAGSVGIDHNKHSTQYCKDKGLVAYTTSAFSKSKDYKKSTFDSLLLSHVLEHMTPKDGIALIRAYAPMLKAGGKLIICCPQEKGYTTDSTHVNFLDGAALGEIVKASGFTLTKNSSFPFPRPVGIFFRYNEFTIVATKNR
jgi:2-polyprenyl-3-methyl-5-hydroxy-6-metoxy-1,4-benzoquinol methylase